MCQKANSESSCSFRIQHLPVRSDAAGNDATEERTNAFFSPRQTPPAGHRSAHPPSTASRVLPDRAGPRYGYCPCHPPQRAPQPDEGGPRGSGATPHSPQGQSQSTQRQRQSHRAARAHRLTTEPLLPGAYRADQTRLTPPVRPLLPPSRGASGTGAEPTFMGSAR